MFAHIALSYAGTFFPNAAVPPFCVTLLMASLKPLVSAALFILLLLIRMERATKRRRIRCETIEISPGETKKLRWGVGGYETGLAELNDTLLSPFTPHLANLLMKDILIFFGFLMLLTSFAGIPI